MVWWRGVEGELMVVWPAPPWASAPLSWEVGMRVAGEAVKPGHSGGVIGIRREGLIHALITDHLSHREGGIWRLFHRWRWLIVRIWYSSMVRGASVKPCSWRWMVTVEVEHIDPTQRDLLL